MCNGLNLSGVCFPFGGGGGGGGGGGVGVVSVFLCAEFLCVHFVILILCTLYIVNSIVYYLIVCLLLYDFLTWEKSMQGCSASTTVSVMSLVASVTFSNVQFSCFTKYFCFLSLGSLKWFYCVTPVTSIWIYVNSNIFITILLGKKM